MQGFGVICTEEVKTLTKFSPHSLLPGQGGLCSPPQGRAEGGIERETFPHSQMHIYCGFLLQVEEQTTRSLQRFGLKQQWTNTVRVLFAFRHPKFHTDPPRHFSNTSNIWQGPYRDFLPCWWLLSPEFCQMRVCGSPTGRPEFCPEVQPVISSSMNS